MFNMNEIGNKISLLRKSANLTQMELANRLGISFQAVSNWERGISMPDISNLGLLAEILGVTVDELIGDKKASDIITGADTPDSISVEEFNAVSPLLSPEKNRELLDVIKTDGMTEQSAEKLSDSVNLAACSFDSAEISAVAEKADIILGSREEFDLTEKLLGLDGTDKTSAAFWHKKGAAIVVIKHGKDGSTAYTNDGESYNIKPFPVKLLKSFGGGGGDFQFRAAAVDLLAAFSHLRL